MFKTIFSILISILKGIAFYLLTLAFFIGLGMFLGYFLTDKFGMEMTQMMQAVRYIGTAAMIIVVFLLLKIKGLLVKPVYIVLGLLTVILMYFLGAIVALIPLAFVATKKKKK